MAGGPPLRGPRRIALHGREHLALNSAPGRVEQPARTVRPEQSGLEQRALNKKEPLSRSFHHFLWTRLLGTAANQMLLVALAWQMYDLTGSAWDLGLVGLVQFLPAIVLTIPAGQLVDRVDRRLVLGLSLALQAVVALWLAWGTWGGWVQRDLILAMSVILGIARALQAPAQQAIVPSLVPQDQLARAMALSTAMMKVAVIGGPALGGFLYATGAEIVYGLCAAFSVLSLAFVASIRKAEALPRAPITLASMFAGFHFIWTHKVVLGAISLDLFAVLLGGATALLPIYAKDVLHTGPWGLGLLRSAPAIGALLMAVVIARAPVESHIGRRMFISVAIYGVSILVFGVSSNFILSMVALAVGGAADMISIVIRQTLVQLQTPEDMRGRVSAVNSTFISASNQLGEFRAGSTAAAGLGAMGSVLFGGLGTLIVVGLWIRLFPQLARIDTWPKKPEV
jgi:MFS family permease